MNKAITWESYFMGIARLSALRSKDPNTRVGCCIAGKDNRILSVGYNGMPNGCGDTEFPWTREGGFGETKYEYVVHAELNAILNQRGQSLEGGVLYVTSFPCNECAKAIIQAGIKRVVYAEEYIGNGGKGLRMMEASRRMFDAAGVEYVKAKEES